MTRIAACIRPMGQLMRYASGRYHLTAPSLRAMSVPFSTDLGPNPGLESVISQGIQSLERSAADVQGKTRNQSLVDHNNGGPSKKSKAPNPRQLAEAQRILDIASDCLEELCERGIGNMYLGGEPMIILHVEVNRTAKQAKVYWTLPYGVLVDSRLTASHYQRLMAILEEKIVAGGGGRLLAGQVHNRLRSYYPPRLRLLPATPAMLQSAMEEYSDDH